MEESNSVDISATLETQRFRLLRLLAGLICIVQFVSLVPLVSVLPFQIRSYVSSILDRAEAAVDCLVIVTAATICGCRVPASAVDLTPPLDLVGASEDHVSSESLLHRIAVLRAVLGNLPLYAKRLMKRLKRAPMDTRIMYPGDDATSDARFLNLEGKVLVTRFNRPPDKQLCAAQFLMAAP